MKTHELTLEELNEVAYRALAKALGPVDMVRFLRQFKSGQGDYTRDRHKWLDKVDSNEFVEEIFRRQREQKQAMARPKARTRKTG